jgi:hypothetical protein
MGTTGRETGMPYGCAICKRRDDVTFQLLRMKRGTRGMGLHPKVKKIPLCGICAKIIREEFPDEKLHRTTWGRVKAHPAVKARYQVHQEPPPESQGRQPRAEHPGRKEARRASRLWNLDNV